MARKKNSAAVGNPRTKWFYTVFAVVGIAAVATIGYSLVSSRSGGAAVERVELAGVENPRDLMEMARPERKGEPNAPVQIHTFIDFQCPACGQYATQIEPRLESYVNDGAVQIVYYDFPLSSIHPHAFIAARAARCAGDQGEYWAFHDVLFAEQANWSGQGNAQEDFFEYADRLGLEGEAFRACVRSDRHADLVSANATLGEQLGVTGTPTLYVNGRVVQNAFDYERITAMIDEELANSN